MSQINRALSLTLTGASVLALLTGLSGCGVKSEKQSIDQLENRVAALEAKMALLEPKSTSSTEVSDTGTQSSNPTTHSTKTFSDIDNSVPTADMIGDLTQLGVFDSLGSTFNPTQTITRAEYVTWLYYAYNALHPTEKQIRMSPGYKVPYADIAPSHPAYKYVQALGNAGFSVGYQDKTFKPDKVLTREEMLAIKQGINGNYDLAGDYVTFSDKAQIDKRFFPAVNVEVYFNTKGIRGGDVTRAFGSIKALKPKEPVLRYEAAATLWQMDFDGTYTAAKSLGRDK